MNPEDLVTMKYRKERNPYRNIVSFIFQYPMKSQYEINTNILVCPRKCKLSYVWNHFGHWLRSGFGVPMFNVKPAHVVPTIGHFTDKEILSIKKWPGGNFHFIDYAISS